MDIIFIKPYFTLYQMYGPFAAINNRHPNFGICSLASYCRKHNISTRIFDLSIQKFRISSLIKEIKSLKTKVIGFTATTPEINSAAIIAHKLKKHITFTSVIGGPHISALPKKTMELYKQFDIGVIGEGEQTIVDLINTIKSGDDLKNIRGIIYRKNEELVQTENRELIKDLSILPFPAFDLLPGFPFKYHPGINSYLKLPAIPFLSSRGCPFNCIFCDKTIFGNKYREFTVEYMVDFITSMQKKFGIKEIEFMDDIFTLSKKD